MDIIHLLDGASMRIEKTYKRSNEELHNRIDKSVDNLQSLQIPGDILIGNILKNWDRNRMPFSFNVAKGFFSTNISGEVLLSGSTVVLDVDIPKMVSAFIDEGKLKTMVGKKMDEIFA